jgi:hypothetical protein
MLSSLNSLFITVTSIKNSEGVPLSGAKPKIWYKSATFNHLEEPFLTAAFKELLIQWVRGLLASRITH